MKKPNAPTGVSTKKTKKDTPKTISRLKKDLWALTKQIVRKTYGNTCYCCGAKDLTGANWHTAHFVPSSICGAGLRYDFVWNLRPSCYRCNVNLSGNWIAFREHLIRDFGIKKVEEIIRRKNDTTRADRYFYEMKIAEYRALVDNS